MEFADPFTCRSTCTESLMLDVIMVFFDCADPQNIYSQNENLQILPFCYMYLIVKLDVYFSYHFVFLMNSGGHNISNINKKK